MMKLNAIILYLVVFITGFNPVMGQKHDKDFLTHKVILNQADRTIVAYVKPSGNVNIEVDKRYYWLSSNQIRSTQGGFSGKLLNGTYEEFYLNKGLKESGKVYKGLKTGVWKRWAEQGNLIDDYNWSAGQKHGIYHKYDSLGRVKEMGKYKNNLLRGKQWLYTAEGVKQIRYKDGKAVEHKKIKIPQFIRKIFYKKPKSV